MHSIIMALLLILLTTIASFILKSASTFTPARWNDKIEYKQKFRLSEHNTRLYVTMNGIDETCTHIIAIITLDRHKNGIWISKLKEELSSLCATDMEYQGKLIKLQPVIYTLESLQMTSDFAEGEIKQKWLCIVNRVSDAAGPVDVKVRYS